MDRITATFKKKKPFIGYLTGGDGGLEYSLACARALIDGGVDMLEIGMPFSDPVADGPVIQRSHARALAAGANAGTILELAKRLRAQSDIPLILFSYYNPLLQKGVSYLHQLKQAGYDAALTLDLPLSATSKPFYDALAEAQLLPIFLATPSTDEERLQEIAKVAKGFLYYVSQKGTTGVRKALAADFEAQITRLCKIFQIPIAAGFGIADRVSAQEALKWADGFVVGSAIVQKIEEYHGVWRDGGPCGAPERLAPLSSWCMINWAQWDDEPGKQI